MRLGDQEGGFLDGGEGTFCGVGQEEVFTFPRDYKESSCHIIWPLASEILQDPLDTAAVGVAGELF